MVHLDLRCICNPRTAACSLLGSMSLCGLRLQVQDMCTLYVLETLGSCTVFKTAVVCRETLKKMGVSRLLEVVSPQTVSKTKCLKNAACLPVLQTAKQLYRLSGVFRESRRQPTSAKSQSGVKIRMLRQQEPPNHLPC